MARRRRPHGLGCVYQRGKSGWRIKWRENGKPQYLSGFASREQAAQALNHIIGEVAAGRAGLPGRSKVVIPLFKKAAEDWVKLRSAPDKDGNPLIRSWKDDDARVRLYLIPFFGKKRLDEIRRSDVKAFIKWARQTLAPQSIRNCLNALSRLFNDYVEDNDDVTLVNPVSHLDRATRRSVGPKWDPKKTPFLQTKDDVSKLYLAFPEMKPKVPWRPMFAVGVFGGLRPGEIQALEWGDISFEEKRIHVLRSVSGPLKDDESRVVPMCETLVRVLKEWRRASPPTSDLCFPATGNRGVYMKVHRMHEALRDALTACGLPRLTWYQATRHSFGSQWVIAGGSLEKLRVILGHSTTEVTQRYAHLVPGQFTEAERKLVDVELWGGEVVPFPGAKDATKG